MRVPSTWQSFQTPLPKIRWTDLTSGSKAELNRSSTPHPFPAIMLVHSINLNLLLPLPKVVG